ncbi:hypothetical protein [Magnetospirillum sp. 15-1]|uniref:hypothetical protein n=1 Tax=Magnetospirillum sp. 15-1 TaxID=1979370 RepID=UPI000BBB79A2|nr:hypothetical protein [Magnetospirillum sp. 15-1]
MFNSFTGDIKDAARRHLHTWKTALGLTTRQDHAAIEQVITEAYRAAGLTPPRRIVWCPSPLAMTWVRTLSTEMWQQQVGANVRDTLIDEPIRRAWPLIQACMSQGFCRELSEYLEGGLIDAVRAKEQALWNALSDECATCFDTLPLGVRAAITETLTAEGLPSTDLSALALLYYGTDGFVWGPVESQAITLAFVRKRMKLESETQAVTPLISLLEQSHTFIAHENVFWISEPPRFISENTMHYGDGWTVTVSPELQGWSRRLSLSSLFGDAVLP